jgi:hypothetical protein
MGKMTMGQASLQALSPAYYHSTVLHVHLSGAWSGEFISVPLNQLQPHITWMSNLIMSQTELIAYTTDTYNMDLFIQLIKVLAILCATFSCMMTCKETCRMQITATQPQWDKCEVPVSQTTHGSTITKANLLMLFVVRIIWDTEILCVGRIQSFQCHSGWCM